MSYTRSELSSIIAEKTIKKPNKNLAKEVAAYLVEYKHIADLDIIMREVLAYRFEHGLIEATLVTAHTVEQVHITEATALLKELFPGAKHYSVETLIDETMLGGAKLIVAGKQIDLTFKNKLSRLKRLTTA